MSDDDLKFELTYIAESPPEEHGGFNPRVVAVAKAALLVLAERDAIAREHAELVPLVRYLIDCANGKTGYILPVKTLNKLATLVGKDTK